MNITAVVAKNTIKLPVDIPDGTRVEIKVLTETGDEEAKNAESFFDRIRDLIGSVEGPEDWAAEHDHYIHGTPKRGKR